MDKSSDEPLTSKQEELRSGLAARQQGIGQTEHAASVIRVYTVVVPGLLQTAHYARRVFTTGEGLVPGVVRDISAAVTARLEGQQVLYQPGKQFAFVVPEGALRWRPGPDGAPVLAAQLDRVAALSTLASVTFGIIPWSADVYALAPNEFAIFGDPEKDEDVEVVIETVTQVIHIRDAGQIAVYLTSGNGCAPTPCSATTPQRCSALWPRSFAAPDDVPGPRLA